eukprot:TRINITY_DN12046_c0_g1_i1.p1 TRINITY_DN12046_c0_g1~~TRINITY_DN12046_c0_g1_i1.p1  ORF type:complete len:240 (-),score=40.15 TRINITY_DN12046_c0_g1_i1:295-1014(-)
MFWYILLLTAAAAAPVQEYVCPPPGFTAVQNFGLDDLAKFIAAPWYVQQQMATAQQPEDYLYCTTASYTPLDPSNVADGVKVLNYANKGKVNGPPIGTSGAGDSNLQLIAIVPDPTMASKLRVGLPSLRPVQKVSYGDYWIVAVKPSANETIGYDWAIISGGPPTTSTANGCRTGSKWSWIEKVQINQIGLWLFTREKVASEQTVQEMRETAKDLGFDLSVLDPVEQEGCLYIDSNPTN